MARKRKASPPWWVKTPLYVATWPSRDCSEWRVSLHRQYLKAQKQGGREAATRLARREAWGYTKAATMRVGWWLVKAIRIFGVAN